MKMIQRAQQSEAQEVDDQGSWMISYGDMITLLLAFFVLFFTVDPQQEKSDQLSQSLVNLLKQEALRSPASQSESSDLSLGAQTDETGIEEKMLQKWGAKIHKVGKKIIVEFPGVSFFNTGNVQPTSDGQKNLEKFAKIYEPYQGNYILGVRAFTDKRKVVSEDLRYKDNLELSALRSIATMRVLQKQGVPLNLMKINGYGELILSPDDLLNLPDQKNDKLTELDLARTIVLIIEPIDTNRSKKGGRGA